MDVDGSVTATSSFEVTGRYLNIPVRSGSPFRRVTVTIGDVERAFDIELAEGEPDWWAFHDLGPVAGGTVTVGIDSADSADALSAIHQSDEIVGAESTYREARRPQLRFSARRGWLNDPVGLVYFEGEYHLFYEHNPYGVSLGHPANAETGIWGNASWGHAVSPDLVHWQELPIALYPDAAGSIYSGSAVVDRNDTAGLRTGSAPALIAFYTSAGTPFTQCLAVSNDRGRTWRKYEGNPVIPSPEKQSRDPKVAWHAATGRWVMVLYLDRYDREAPADLATTEISSFGVYTSPDLITWEKTSEFVVPGDTECPGLFELSIQENPGESRWIAHGAKGSYLVGSFDGRVFTPESGPHTLNEGNCFYAAQTFADIPVSDGRRILIPWGTAWATPPAQAPLFAGMPFSQSMGLPVELTLHSTEDGVRLFANPVRELETLRESTTRIVQGPLQPGEDPLSSLTGELWEIEADMELGDASRLVFELRGTPVTYDTARREISCGDRTASLAPVDGRIRLRIFVDRTAIDIFGGDGRLYMPMGVDLSGGGRSLSLRAEGGGARIHRLVVHRLASAWE
jgi:sucrose-6-phosphate hydrolase SacC (GH32 family)